MCDWHERIKLIFRLFFFHSGFIFLLFFKLLLHTMNEHRHKILVGFFYYGRASSDFTSSCIVMCSFWTRLKYDDWPLFCALWRCENALFTGATLWRFIKPAMSTLELIKNQRVDVLSPMSSNHIMSAILTEFENIYNRKHKQWTTLDPRLPMRSPWSSFFDPDQLVFPLKWCHLDKVTIWFVLILDVHPKALRPI